MRDDDNWTLAREGDAGRCFGSAVNEGMVESKKFVVSTRSVVRNEVW